MSRVFLNRYRVLRQVGQGGYGSVFLCEDLRLSGKRWAVKELDCRGERLADFEREAAVLSQLEHPRIPVIVDFFVQDGNGYLVREYLDGPTLHDWIEHRGPVSEAQALHWGIQIAEVLQYLHGRQPPLYHRDLKPQNIVILPDGLRLMDFGLAREEWQEQAGGTGSVSFTAPEQFGGRHRPGAAADIYSLGAILYYMLMGVPPGPTGGEHRLLPQRPMLQPTTETIILQCLNSDPILRPEDAADVSSILQYNAARLPSPPTPTVPRQGELEAPALTKPGTTSSWTLGKAALPLVVLLGLAGMLLFSMPQPDPSKPAPPAETGGVTFAKVQSYLAVQRYAEAEGSLKVTVAGDPGCGWARLLLAQLPLMRHHPNIPRVPLLVPLDGEEAEHVNWVLQGVALAQMEEQRFIYELVDTHGVSVLTVYKDAVERTRTNMVLGPFGSQEALLVAPLATGSQIALLPIGSADPRVQDAGPGVYPVAFPHWGRLGALLRYALQQEGKNGLIFFSVDSKAMSASANFAADELQRSTGEWPQQIGYSEDEENPQRLAAQVQKAQPSWIYVSDNQPQRAARWIKALREAGVQVPVLCIFHPASRGFVADLQGVSGQVWLVEPMWQDHCADFVARFHQVYGKLEADWNSAQGYDLARLAASVWRPGPEAGPLLKDLSEIGLSLPAYRGLLGEYVVHAKTIRPHPFRFRRVVVEGGQKRPGPVLPE